jgi:hypothetical protein
MNNIIIDPTNLTPAVRFSEEGSLAIAGKSLPENTVNFYKPLIEWAGHLSAEEVNLEINLEYLNSASTKNLMDLLRVLDINSQIKTLYVHWYYEADDEDILESGRIFEDFLAKAQFRYHEYSTAN